MKQSKHIHGLRSVAVFAAFGLILAACGSSDASVAVDTTPVVETTR